MEWTTEWPVEPGCYWFYGHCFRDREHSPEFHFVKVRKISNGIAYVTGGHFLFKEEMGYGVWTQVDMPDVPILPEEE